jgi:hypothetical protein
MTHCVFHAFRDHLYYLGIEFDDTGLWQLYKSTKFMFTLNIEQPTNGVVAMKFAGMISALCKIGYLVGNDMPPLEYTIQHRIWTKDHYLADAENDRQRKFIDLVNFGELVDQITLHPAVYLSLSEQHAYFGTVVPTNKVIVAAIQFYLPYKNLHTTRRKMLWTIKSMLGLDRWFRS